MANKQINEFPADVPNDTDLFLAQAADGGYERFTAAQMRSYVLGAIPAEIDYLDLPVVSNTTVNGADALKVQKASDDTYKHITMDSIYLFIANKLYPVGHYYVNHSNSANPSTLLGFGTWVAVRGRVLVGEGSASDINGTSQNFPAGSTGGEYTHTLTAAELATHHHYMYTSGQNGQNPTIGVYAIGDRPEQHVAYDTDFSGNESWQPLTRANQGESDQGRTSYAGSNTAHNNIQPYQTVYMWRRTA